MLAPAGVHTPVAHIRDEIAQGERIRIEMDVAEEEVDATAR